MGGNNRQKKSFSLFAIFNIFKAKVSLKGEDAWDDSVKSYKVWPSDEDRGRWVAEPGIDRKATTYIAKRRAEYECQGTPVSNSNPTISTI